MLCELAARSVGGMWDRERFQCGSLPRAYRTRGLAAAGGRRSSGLGGSTSRPAGVRRSRDPLQAGIQPLLGFDGGVAAGAA